MRFDNEANIFAGSPWKRFFERFDDRHQVNQDVIFVRTDYFDFYRHFPAGDASAIENCVLVDYDHFKLATAKPIEYALDLSLASAQRESLQDIQPGNK